MSELEDNEPSVKDLLANINETLEALLIVNMRLYDAKMLELTAEFDTSQGSAVDNLINAHEAGRILGPMPSYVVEVEDEDDTSEDTTQ